MEDSDKRKIFLNKRCCLEKRDSFYLWGVVLDVTFGPGGGVMFQTDQKTSFIAWDSIITLIPEAVN